jgi:hypothetical protein
LKFSLTEKKVYEKINLATDCGADTGTGLKEQQSVVTAFKTAFDYIRGAVQGTSWATGVGLPGKEHGSIFVPAGDYVPNEQIVVPSDISVRIIGEGQTRTSIRLESDFPGKSVFKFQKPANDKIRYELTGMTIKPRDRDLVRSVDVDKWNRFYKNISYGVSFYHPENVYISNCNLIGYLGGVYLEGGKNATFENVQASGSIQEEHEGINLSDICLELPSLFKTYELIGTTNEVLGGRTTSVGWSRWC